MVTTVRKKRMASSPVDSAEFQQLDGVSFSPPPSPDVRSSGSPSVPTPPPPPPAPNLASAPSVPPIVHDVGLPSALTPTRHHQIWLVCLWHPPQSRLRVYLHQPARGALVHLRCQLPPPHHHPGPSPCQRPHAPLSVVSSWPAATG